MIILRSLHTDHHKSQHLNKRTRTLATMKLSTLWLVAALADLVDKVHYVLADVVLSEKIMSLTKTAAELSALAYEEHPPGEGYAPFGFYDAEPDQALMAKKDGYCFGAFRGTTMTWIDWQQNMRLGYEEVCGVSGECCSMRQGFYDAYETPYKEQFETAIRDCARSCANKDECVVLTGHSQGGAIAAVAALNLADLNPYLISFGQPNTVDAPCALITSERWYRYVNTEKSGKVGIVYDPVPFVPGLGTDAFGHMILLSADSSGVAWIGLDAQDFFSPLNVAGFEAHSMIGTEEYPGYLDRIEAIMGDTTYPVRTSGYIAGSLCSEDQECESQKCDSDTAVFSFNRCVGIECKEDGDCDTNRCDNGICLPKLGSCQECNEDSDCAGGECILFRCSGSSGLMDDNCICRIDSDCYSGRCEGYAPPQCEAQLGLGAYCDEGSDCLSGYCSWSFQCEKTKPGGSYCRKNTECESGHCTWRFKCSSVSRSMDFLAAGDIVPFEDRYADGSQTLDAASQHAILAATDGKETHEATVGMTFSVVAVVILGTFIGRKKILHWYRGYQEIPPITLEV